MGGRDHPGPHASPDFLTEDDWRDLIGRERRVDLNSDRVSTRRNPHRFTWARPDGGIAGGHPSNVLDDAYPVGGVLANGDVLTILGIECFRGTVDYSAPMPTSCRDAYASCRPISSWR
ncbi:hypothetical protein ACIHDR_43785 [Nocardia sp. NPDC052278]|uniref:hypothetical protein n=1 Tax=unclassified Nocardia TaxID=2637762 RepID=UPI0036C9FCA5